MQPEDRERILWQLSTANTPLASGHAVDDERLEAYRRGELDEQESAEVVRQLTQHPASRRRLLQLGGITDAPPSPQVLRRLLVSLRPAATRRYRPLRVAALLAASLAAVFFGGRLMRSTVPETASPPAYTVGIAALAVHRDGPTPGPSATANAETSVSITATIQGKARRDVALALFRQVGDQLERVDNSDGLSIIERRGAARFSAQAHSLVGDQPGEHLLFLVVAWQGDLPQVVSLPPGSDPATQLAADGRRRVYRLPLLLLPPATGPPAHGEDHGPT